MTLEINNRFFDLDAVFTYPIDLTGDGGAWSTDFELPATAEVLAAFGLGAFLSQPTAKVIDARLYAGGVDSYPCKVYLRGYKDSTVSAYLTLNVLPSLYNARVCDIAANAGQDWLFNYPQTSYYTDNVNVQWLPYQNGRGTTPSDLIMPCVRAVDLLQTVTAWAGGQINTAGVDGDLYVVLNSISPSPEVKKLRWTTEVGGGVEFVAPCGYFLDRQNASSSLVDFRWRMRGSGTLTNVKILAVSSYNVQIQIYTASGGGTPVQTLSSNDNSWHSLNNISFPLNEVIRVVALTTPFNYVAVTFQADIVTPTVPVMPDHQPWAVEWIMPTPDSPLTFGNTGVCACITQTLQDLCADIAAVSGRVLQYRGGQLYFLSDTPLQLQKYTIEGYDITTDEVGQNNYAVYANDSDEEPHRDLLATYSGGDELAESVELIKMSADQATTGTDGNGNDIAVFRNFNAGGDLQWGHNYWLAMKDSNTGNLVPAVASSAMLPPPTSQLITATAVVYDDVSHAIRVAMDGREWLLTEREQQADGSTNIKALLY